MSRREYWPPDEHERLVTEFLVDAKREHPELAANLSARYPVLTARELAQRARREVGAFAPDDETYDGDDEESAARGRATGEAIELANEAMGLQSEVAVMREARFSADVYARFLAEKRGDPEPLWRREPQSEQQRLWRLRQQGLSYRQIARETGKALGTVKATLHQARRRRGV